jgi:hypothetical protein
LTSTEGCQLSAISYQPEFVGAIRCAGFNKKLEELQLYHTNVTLDGVSRFRLALPNCLVLNGSDPFGPSTR